MDDSLSGHKVKHKAKGLGASMYESGGVEVYKAGVPFGVGNVNGIQVRSFVLV